MVLFVFRKIMLLDRRPRFRRASADSQAGVPMLALRMGQEASRALLFQ